MLQTNTYTTYPALAWILAHYFYEQNHYTYLAAEYFPYRLPNPKSSNPHLLYQDFYQPWRDRDQFDKTVLQARLNLRKGVIVHAASPPSGWGLDWADKLRTVCDDVDLAFFYPIVYRVAIDGIKPPRLRVAGSGVTAASHEWLVEDLSTHTEIELLFADDRSDADLKALLVDAVGAAPPSAGESADALRRLLARC